MNLPPALAPWAPFLEEFPLEVAPAVGEMARRLSQIIGPTGAGFDALNGEIDGYDGLSRRGSPDRMLMSDWILATEAPDEWARRAGENELSFLQLARKTPRHSASVAAIFDAGPGILGAPRLGQLAALLVLARRAREMGAELVWGIAQKSRGGTWRGLAPSGALALLEARGAAPATAQDLDVWRETLGANEEIWLVGAREIEGLALPHEAILRFDDPFDTGRALDVVAKRGGQVHSARLPLPTDRICTRLLRNPFGAVESVAVQSRRVKSTYKPKSPLIWLNGHTLGAHTHSGGIAVFRVPSSPRGGVPKPKHYSLHSHAPHHGHAPHFICEWNGAILSAAVTPERLHINLIGGKSQNVPSLYAAEDLLSPVDMGALWSVSRAKFQPFLMGFDSTIFQVRPQETESEHRGNVTPVLREVVAAAQFANGIVALTRPGSGEATSRIVRLQANAAKEFGFQLLSDEFPLQNIKSAIWGGAPGMEETTSGWGILAIQNQSGWMILWSQNGEARSQGINLKHGETVLGAIGHRAKWPSPALLVLSEDKRVLSLRGPDWTFQITSGEPIESAAASLLTPYVCWQTARETAVYSLAAGAILARWEWEES
ncbi:MAG TPA: hypothetical protein VGB45_03965 [Abditibacterium sp.]|jgi:hypothetical protein